MVSIIEELKTCLDEDYRFKDLIEEVRSANESLREWGTGEEADNRELREDNANLSAQVDSHETHIRNLENLIVELENE